MTSKSWDVIQIMKDARGFLTPHQVKTFLEGCKNTMEYSLFFTLVNTGRRVCEVVGKRYYQPEKKVVGGLKRCDINEHKNMILWNILKKKKEYKVWIATKEEVINQLLAYVEQKSIKPTSLIFPLSKQRVYQICRRISKETGLDNERIEKEGETKWVHPHEFRHTFAINFLETLHSAEDLVKLQKILCHSSIRVTESYLRYTSKDTQDVVEKMPLFK